MAMMVLPTRDILLGTWKKKFKMRRKGEKGMKKKIDLDHLLVTTGKALSVKENKIFFVISITKTFFFVFLFWLVTAEFVCAFYLVIGLGI
jgi:hypothetical protein